MPPATSFSLACSSAWLLALFSLSLWYVWRQLRRSRYSLWENCLYVPTLLMGRLRWRVRFANDPPPALAEGAVLVANHRSSVDPFFVQLAAGRRVHWMVAKEYCEHFLFGRILRLCQVIPTNRSGMDTASTKAAIRITREGRLVGMFPEGRINRTQRPLLPLKSGAAVVAAQANVPMIPLWIEGSPYRDTVWSPVFMRARVTITFGDPISPEQTNNCTQQSRETSGNSDALILAWGRQILQLSGRAQSPLELAAARRRAGRSGRRTKRSSE